MGGSPGSSYKTRPCCGSEKLCLNSEFKRSLSFLHPAHDAAGGNAGNGGKVCAVSNSGNGISRSIYFHKLSDTLTGAATFCPCRRSWTAWFHVLPPVQVQWGPFSSAGVPNLRPASRHNQGSSLSTPYANGLSKHRVSCPQLLNSKVRHGQKQHAWKGGWEPKHHAGHPFSSTASAEAPLMKGQPVWKLGSATSKTRYSQDLGIFSSVICS